ncbi:recombinase family protein [Paenibacillus selenitireducens]|uniref:Recombinase family protein n=1 Tax=Paenibacillus selenitireducens TaxID=1324314 RepID=A0A1T2XM33_9BACL|nr:recombinase family protein [Paenibacillus selenitireducens]OPA80806.1 recombinase family protein [Paenibacillus selenitireducens]
MQADTRIKCAIYARVSTDQQGDSIDNQVSQCEEYIHRLGEQYDVSDIIIYRDEAVSGYYTSVFDRHEMRQAIQDAREHRFKLLVFKEVSRVGRDKQENPAIIGMFEQYGVRVVAINDNYDSLNKDNITFDILSVLSEQESKKISSRVSSARKQKARRGQWGGEPPIGYVVNRATKRLETDPVQRHIPALMFELYVHHGLGTFRVAQELNRRGMRTKNGNPWTRESVNKILRNQAYIGNVVYGTRRNQLKRQYDDSGKMSKRKVQIRTNPSEWQIAEGAHEAIVDPELFQAAQEILQRKSKSTSPRRAYHPLTGLLYCGRCQQRMVCQKRASGGNAYRYYVCSTAHKYGRESCSQPNISADPLEMTVLDAIRRQLDQIKKEQFDITIDRSRDVERLQQELAMKQTQRNKRNKDQLDLFRQRELFEHDTYTQQMLALKEQLVQLEEEIAATMRQMAVLKQAEGMPDMLQAAIQRLKALQVEGAEATRAVFQELLNRVTITNRHIELVYDVFFVRENMMR